MTVKEMLSSIDFEDIWQWKDLFLNYKTDVEEELVSKTYRGYKKAWDTLLELEPILDPKMYLIGGDYFDILTYECDEDCPKDPFPIQGTVSVFNTEDDTTYSILLVKWEEVLGWEVSSYCMDHFGKVKLAAYLLYELTFFGIDYKDVVKEQEKLEQELKETDEQIKRGEYNGIPFEKFMKELGMESKEEIFKKPVVDQAIIDKYMQLNKELEEMIIKNTKKQAGTLK